MFKIIIKFLFLYYLLVGAAFSKIISNIEVNGNQRISNESIIVFTELKLGSEYSNEKINKSIKKLYNTNFFKNISVTTTEDFKVIINVVEKPLIERININGIKKTSFLEFIKKNIFLKERFSFDEQSLSKDISSIKNILQTNGYYFSSIETSYLENDILNTIVLNIDIKLGNKAKIQEISFIGNKIYKNKKLKEIIASEQKNLSTHL